MDVEMKSDNAEDDEEIVRPKGRRPANKRLVAESDEENGDPMAVATAAPQNGNKK